jgi:hypothetical protein
MMRQPLGNFSVFTIPQTHTMKTLLNLTLFLTLTSGLKAQITNSVYLDYTCQWHFYASGWTGIHSFEEFTTVYMDGDTTIGGQQYYKQFRYRYSNTYTYPSYVYDLTGPYFVREDAGGNSYYYSLYYGIESLFMDNVAIAAANVNDSMPVPGSSCTVSSIVNHSIASQTLHQLMGINYNPGGLLEGVGYVGPVCAIGVEGGTILCSYSRQGETLGFCTIPDTDFPVPTYQTAGINMPTDSPVSIYPNPATEYIVIDPNTDGELTLKLTGSLGEKIKELPVTGKTTLDVSSLRPGIYFVTVYDNGHAVYNHKLVIEQ